MALAKEAILDLKSTFSSSNLYKLFGLASTVSGNENDKFPSIFIRHFTSSSLAATSLIDMPNNYKGYDSHTMFETCISSLLSPSSSLPHCCTYSSDITSSMVGKNKSLLKLTKDGQGESPQKIFYIGCTCHFAHFCAQKGAKALLCQYKLVILLLTCFTILKEV